MDYEKEYKKIVGKIKKAYLHALTDSTNAVLEEILPSLAESEDERVRKWLINDIKQAINGDIYNDENIIDAKKALAFLEKQGEKHPDPYNGISFEYNGHIWGMCARDNGVDISCDKHLIKHLEKQAEVKESTISQHENKMCKENNNSLTSEYEIRKALLEMVHDTTGDELWADYGVHKEEALDWLEKQGKETSWKPSKEEMDVLYGLAYITNQYDEHKEEVITRLYQDLKREFFYGSSYENMFPNTEDSVRRRSTIQVLEYARSLDTYNQYGKADIDKNIAWLEKQGEKLPEGFYYVNSEGKKFYSEKFKYGNVVLGIERQGEKKPTQSPKGMTKLEEKLSSLVVVAVHTYCEKNLLDTPHFVGLNLGDKMAKEWSKEILTLAEEELRKIEQKPAEEKGNIGGISANWSEEDSQYVEDTLALIGFGLPTHTIGQVQEWLQSLKGRVGCEANCTTTKEWSRDDEQYLLVCKNALAKYQTTNKWDAGIISSWLEDKLKSIKPQNHWKPSDEQMEILLQAVAYFGVSWANKDYLALQSLYFDLKKLKEK